MSMLNAGGGKKRPRRKSSGSRSNVSVPLMTDYGFGVSEGGRIIHFKADGSEDQEAELPHQKERENTTIEVSLTGGKVVAGGCNGQHPARRLVIDETENAIEGHVGLKCLACGVGWIVQADKARAIIDSRP